MLLPLLLALQITPAPQVTPTPKLPPANPLPYADADAAAVLAPVNALFAALAARDGQAVLAQTLPQGRATAVDAGGQLRPMSWQEFAAGLKPGPERLEEQLTDPAIDVDGDIAMVWSPYVFRINGQLRHCGTDHFDLVRVDGHWKLLNATWTQRTSGCPAQ